MSDDETRADLVRRARLNTRKKRARDVIDVRAQEVKPKVGAPVPPTSEQAAHADYVEAPVYEMLPSGRRTVRGRAFQRVAKFEAIEGLTADNLRALRRYRKAFDQSEISETKSALDIRPRGGAGGGADSVMHRLEVIVSARIPVRAIEATIPGGLIDTLRAVALHDVDFKQLAIQRFGGRDVERLDASQRKPIFVTSVEPRSGRHRALIRDEFMAGARALTDAMRPTAKAVARQKAAAICATPEAERNLIDPEFLNEAGLMRELDEIAAIILCRAEAYSEEVEHG